MHIGFVVDSIARTDGRSARRFDRLAETRHADGPTVAPASGVDMGFVAAMTERPYRTCVAWVKGYLGDPAKNFRRVSSVPGAS